MVIIIRVSVKVTLPLEDVIQWQFAPVNREIYNRSIWIRCIPTGFPSIFGYHITINSRYLKWGPHIILMDSLLKLLNDLQVGHKLILNVLALLDILAIRIFRLQMERTQELARKRLGCPNSISNIYLRT